MGIERSDQSKVWFILDEDSAFLAENQNNTQIITSDQELLVLSDQCLKPKAVLVLAEMKRDQNHNTLFPGFHWANFLRRQHRFLAPIIITSTFRRDVFEALSQKNPTLFNILYASGTRFLHVEELYRQIQEGTFPDYVERVPAISRALLEDILEMLLQHKGFIIDKITHDLKYSLSESALEMALEQIRSFLTRKQQEAIAFDNIAQAICEALKKKDENGFNSEKQNLVAACVAHLKGEENSKDINSPNHKKWGRILVVEDDPEQRELTVQKLQDSFDIEATGDCLQALEILEEDSRNEIKAIIADWRLMKYNQGQKTPYWQDFQGYQILERASRTHFAALISLTAEHDKNIHQIRNRLGISIQLFKKEHVFASREHSQWNLFVDILRQEIDKVARQISALPTAANWDKFSAQYREIWTSQEWPTFEMEVSRQADSFWDYFKDALDLNNRGNINKGLQDFLPLNTLRNVLIGRRVFLALYFEYKRIRNDLSYITFSPEQVIKVSGEDKGNEVFDAFAALRNYWWENDASYDEEDFKRYHQQTKNLLKALCIKSEEVTRILPEEKAWLNKHQINPNDLSQTHNG